MSSHLPQREGQIQEARAAVVQMGQEEAYAAGSLGWWGPWASESAVMFGEDIRIFPPLHRTARHQEVAHRHIQGCLGMRSHYSMSSLSQVLSDYRGEAVCSGAPVLQVMDASANSRNPPSPAIVFLLLPLRMAQGKRERSHLGNSSRRLGLVSRAVPACPVITNRLGTHSSASQCLWKGGKSPWLSAAKAALAEMYASVPVRPDASLPKPEPLVNQPRLPEGSAQQNGGLFVPAAAAPPETGYPNQWKHSVLMTAENKSLKIMSLFQMMDQKQHWHFLLKKFSWYLSMVTIFLPALLTLTQSYNWNKMKLSTSKSTGNWTNTAKSSLSASILNCVCNSSWFIISFCTYLCPTQSPMVLLKFPCCAQPHVDVCGVLLQPQQKVQPLALCRNSVHSARKLLAGIYETRPLILLVLLLRFVLHAK